MLKVNKSGMSKLFILKATFNNLYVLKKKDS